jgi:hypothetical protein
LNPYEDRLFQLQGILAVLRYAKSNAQEAEFLTIELIDRLFRELKRMLDEVPQLKITYLDERNGVEPIIRDGVPQSLGESILVRSLLGKSTAYQLFPKLLTRRAITELCMAVEVREIDAHLKSEIT